jgi:hypothetical protein
MERRRKIKLPDGRTVDAIEMPFQTGAEHWNEYLLHDGSVLKLKTVVTEVLKIEGEYDADGNPQYALKSTQIVSVSPSDRARQNQDPKHGAD